MQRSTQGTDSAKEPARIIDVRRIIKDTLDVFRHYPASAGSQAQGEASSYRHPFSMRQAPVPLPTAPPIKDTTSLFSGYHQPSVPLPSVANYAGHMPVMPTQEQAYQPPHSIIAEPTQNDMEKLLQLPGEIIHRLAQDAGYVETESGRQGYSYSQQKSSANSGESGFSFNFGSSGSQTPQSTTAAPIIAAGKPKILMRGTYRNGKL